MRPRFHHGSGRFSHKRRTRAFSHKITLHGLCLYLILCFGLGMGLGLGLGMSLNPGFGLSLCLGLGTGLSIRLSQSLEMPQMPSLDTVHQESTNSIAAENSSVGSVMEVTDENLERISDVSANKHGNDNWENEDAEDKAVKEGAEYGQDKHQTTET